MHPPRLCALIAVIAVVAQLGCANTDNDPGNDAPQAAQRFIESYSNRYVSLGYADSKAQWALNTHIVEGDTTNADRARETGEALAAFTGSGEVIESSRVLLKSEDFLAPLQTKQLRYILYAAASNPQTVADLVRERIAASTEQSEKLFGFTYTLDGQEVSTNEIDESLRTETDLDRRLRTWEASKEVGPVLRPGLEKLQRLRNATVRALDYDDFFAYQVSDYGMSTAEMMALTKELNRELRPLYRELHTYFRHTLAEKYGQPVPDLIPAHWLPNRWGQDWSALVSVEGLDLDAALEKKTPEWLVEPAERFFVSLGFEPLPVSFYEKSSLYPLSAEATYKKNNHASAWHMDLDRDVRSLMSVETNTNWYATTHHELGHIYYYLSYTNPDVPVLLRGGADRAFHEAIGSLMGLAAMQPRFVAAVGLVTESAGADPIQTLLQEALDYVVLIPWGAGVMTEFEHDLYAGELPSDQWNRRWWELKAKYQGIAPPSQRDERWCDAATKTHINNDPAQYYDYAISYVLLFQFHDHIARNILNEDPHNTNYFGRKDVGEYLAGILRPGATVDSRKLLRETTGQELSAKAMRDYFEPLMEWLVEQNRGRSHTLPEI